MKIFASLQVGFRLQFFQWSGTKIPDKSAQFQWAKLGPLGPFNQRSWESKVPLPMPPPQ